jgi:hypothetical protein
MRMKRSKPPELNLLIGHQRLGIRLDDRTGGLHAALVGKFAAHLCEPLPTAVRLDVSTWTRRRTYRWQEAAIRPLTAGIKTALERMPRTHPVQQRLERITEILHHTDPQHEVFGRLTGGNGDADSMVFAMSGDNLFFYRPRRRMAAIVLRKTWRPAHMLAGVLNGAMFVLSFLLMQTNGLLLHGCAVERGGTSVLLVGRSGSGKTTAGRLCRPDTCYADDGVVVVHDGHRFRVHPSPFRQIEGDGGSADGSSGVLEKVLLLEKHARDRLAALDKHAMMLFILRHAIHFYRYLDDATARKGFETARRLVETLPVYRLRFTRTGDIWPLISGNP